MVKVKQTPALAAAPQLAEPAPEHTYGWNVMSTCISADVVLEHKSKLDSFELFVARTPEGVWVGGGRATYKTGGYGCDASLKNPGYPTFAEAAHWAAGGLLLLDKAEKLTPNARRKLESLAALLPAPTPTEQQVEWPWLDCDGNDLCEGDKATVLPDVSQRLSGKLVQVLGDYDPKSKSVQVEPVGWEGEPFGILLCYLKRLPVLAENLEEPFDPYKLPHFTEVRAEQDAAAATSLAAHQASVGRITSGITSVGSPSPELVAKVKRAGRKQEPVAPLAHAGEIAREVTPPTAAAPVPKPSTFDALQDGVVSYKAGLRVLPLASITVTRNTRRVFDETALAELASSIQAHGVLQPIVVRPAAEAGHYELVAGERRYRAALAAGLTEIPATVRTLTDREFLEVQLLENLQRVDVRPADEAEAFAKLLGSGYSAEEIGLKVGKGEKFVLQRAKLASLIPFWFEALAEGRLLLTSANELARLPVHSQLLARQSFGENAYPAGFPAREISSVIERKVLRDLEKAPWDKADATLVPSAGACTTCPKRSAAQALLFEQQEGPNLCLDGGCFATKLATIVSRKAAELKQELGKAPLQVTTNYSATPEQKAAGIVEYSSFNWCSEGASGAVPALVVDGADAGQVRHVRLAGMAAMKQGRAASTEAQKAEEAAKLRRDRTGKMLRIVIAEQLTRDLEAAPTGLAAEATLRWLIEEELRGQSTSKLDYLVTAWAWPEASEQQLDHWKDYDPNGERPYTNYLRTHLGPLNFTQLLRLYLSLQVRHKMDYEYEQRQEKIAKLVGASYDGLQREAEQAVEARYYTKKGKKQEASA